MMTVFFEGSHQFCCNSSKPFVFRCCLSFYLFKNNILAIGLFSLGVCYSMELIWNEAKAALKDHVPGHSYRMWIEPLVFHQQSDGRLVLECPNLFSRRRILDNYCDVIESEISRISGRQIDLAIEIADGTRKPKLTPEEERQLPLPNINGHINRGRFLRSDFTFDQFVVSGNNDFAYSAALSLASGKGTVQNSLYLLSKTGMGKSHLSQSVGNHITAQFPAERVFYITAEDFTNECVDAFRQNTIGQFKKKYRNNCDVLLLEDIHYISGKKTTQIELSIILDALLECNKKIIFSSCYLPAEIPKLNDKLESSLTGGLISVIEPPNYRTRVRILQKKSKMNGYDIPDDVTHYLAGELLEDVRQLESGLKGVAAKSGLLGMPINIDLAESVVKNLVRRREKITINVIKKLVCQEYNVSTRDLISRSRKQNIVRPRQIGMYLSRRFTDAPLQEIGKGFNRYHATVLHSIGIIEKELRKSVSMRKQIELLSGKLEAGNAR